ncbi:hypothetical protein, partial [Zooshikella sp. RANM57]
TLSLSDNTAAQLTNEFFIKLSKLIRYCQSTGLSPQLLSRLIHDYDMPGDITSLSLIPSGHIKQYMERYNINEEEAYVLAGQEIN